MFNALQRLQTIKQIRNENGHFVKVGARVVVIKMKGNEVVARDLSFTRKKGEPRAPRIIAPVDAFVTTKRGRPVLEK